MTKREAAEGAAPAGDPASTRTDDTPPWQTPSPGAATGADGAPAHAQWPHVGDRYAIEAELGRGGMGRVYAARDLKLQRSVAIKLLNWTRTDRASLRRFEQEARAAGTLEHPHILAIHDAGLSPEGPYIVSELLQGQTLRSLLARGPLDLGEAVGLLGQLALGLAAAHERGIVHRDIKPENLFVTRDGFLKVLDFGIAKLLEPEEPVAEELRTQAGAIVGTLGYMSPEQIRGQPVDARSDVFGFGVVAYEMLAGRRPFQGASRFELATATLRDPAPPLPPHLSPPLPQIVQRCLQKEPAQRFRDARELAEALRPLRNSTGPSTPWLPPQARQRRTALAAAALAVALGGALFALARRPAQQAQPEFRQLTFHPGAVWSARFAPDGNTVFYTEAWEGGPPAVYSTRLSMPEARRPELQRASLLAVTPASELLVLLRPEFGAFDFQGVLARVTPDGAAPREILERVEYADVAPGGALALVRVADSRRQLEYPEHRKLFETTGWISQPRVSRDGARVAFLHHPKLSDEDGELRIAGPDGTTSVLAGGFSSAQGLAWSPSGDEVWLTALAGNEPGGKPALRAVSLSGAQRLLARVAGALKLEDVAPDGQALATQPLRHLGLSHQSLADGTERDLSWLDLSILNDISADGSLVLFATDAFVGESRSILLRKIDGSPAVRLGPAIGGALSPDGKVVLALPVAGPQEPLHLLPTGPGEPRALPTGGVRVTRARFFPDGQRVLLAGEEPDRAGRLYVLALDGSAPRPLTEEGVVSPWLEISRDGSTVATLDARGRLALYPVAGGPPRVPAQIPEGDIPYGWADDGTLFEGRPLEAPVHVFRFDPRTGERRPWRTIKPGAPGAFGIGRLMLTPDGRSAVYSYAGVKTHLYLVTGLR